MEGQEGQKSPEVAPHEPIYTMEDAENIIRRIMPCAYGVWIDLCEGIKIRFTDVGHLLGSSSIEVWATEEGQLKKLVFSGDIGNKNQLLIKDPAMTREADYVVMESTYGNRLHPTDHLDYVTELRPFYRKPLTGAATW